MKKASFLWLVLLFFNITIVLAQQKIITGTVSDQGGLPLLGVNIVVKVSK